MTEKEFRNKLTEIEFNNKPLFDSVYQKVNDVLSTLGGSFDLVSVIKVGLYSKQLLINSSNIVELGVCLNVGKTLNETLKQKVILNSIENQLILNFDCLSSNVKANQIMIKTNDFDLVVNVLNEEEVKLEVLKNKLIEAINSKYSYYKNTFKLIKGYMNEIKVDVLSDEALMILLAYSLEKYSSSNKYDNYIFNFIRSLDDFINQKKIEIEDDYQILQLGITESLKTYQILSPFVKGINLASNVNETNIAEVRKLKKRLQKLFETENTEIGSSILKLNINPIVLENGLISWHYEVIGRNLKNSGGEFENSEVEGRNATLKAYFRGLKAIVSSDINNKNITVVTKYKDILKCINDANYSEVNSRVKTIVKYIEDNKLLISYSNN